MTTNIPRVIAWATIIATVVSAASVGSIGVATYLNARSVAIGARDAKVAALEAMGDDMHDTVRIGHHLELVSAQLMREVSGMVADPTTEQSLREAHIAVTSSSANLLAFAALLPRISAALPARVEDRLAWPPSAYEIVTETSPSVATTSFTVAAWQLLRSEQALRASHATWMIAQEQQRAAEERAAQAASAARESEAASTGADVSARIADVIHALEPRAIIEWDTNLCSGSHICANTVIGAGAPVVHLDLAVMGRYLGHAGMYVLTHESAHARSWFRYGSVQALYDVSTALMTDGRNGSAAAEFMADCATIVKIGYSMGTYTSSCTPSQLDEARTYW